MASAFDEVLERAQLAQTDGAARVKLLGGVADLGAHPKLASVGEAGRGVHVHAGGVHPELECARGGRVFGENRLGVPGAVTGDVLDRLLLPSLTTRDRQCSAPDTLVSQSSSTAGVDARGGSIGMLRGTLIDAQLHAGVAHRLASALRQ